MRHLGTALVVSGPSGAGKTTVCRRLQEAFCDLHFSVSCTTRAPRTGEEDARDYYFIDRRQFETRAAAGEFLEYAEVHGNLYGTLRTEVERHVHSGQDVLLDIDVQGARQVREKVHNSFLGDCTVFVFFAPPSFAELEQRLRGRATDNEDVIQRRLYNAKNEMRAWREYDYLIINTQVDTAVAQITAVLEAAHCRTNRFPRDLLEG